MGKFTKETQVVHGISTSHTTSKDLVPPVHLSSTFKFKSVEHGASVFKGEEDGFIYSRIANPTVDLLIEKMSVIENGEAALATSSGMSAISSVILSLAKPDDNFISCNSIYGGTFAFFNEHLKKFKIIPHFVPASSFLEMSRIEDLIDNNTRFIFFETPANPTIDVIDIEMAASVAKKHNIYLVVDNTFATSYLQNPLDIGADLVVHSATKYLGGHGDSIGGIIVGQKKIIKLIKEHHIVHFGPMISPFNAWLILRGIKTLALRMEKHCENAMEIAKWLEKNPKIEKVYYPGLLSHKGHDIAKKQMKKFGGIISFEIKGGIDAGKMFMNRLKMCIMAVSLGDCETLIQHPASMTHSTYSKKERQKAGINDGLIRLSVGIENSNDIIHDLEQALL